MKAAHGQHLITDKRPIRGSLTEGAIRRETLSELLEEDFWGLVELLDREDVERMFRAARIREHNQEVEDRRTKHVHG